MKVHSIIKGKLEQAFAPSHCEIVNESHQHNVPKNSETHFKLVIVSDQFVGMRKVARQQQVYRVLSDELAGGVHALSMFTFTSEEWANEPAQLQNSPPCLGGGGVDS